MKKTLILLALTIACSVNAQIQQYQTRITGSTTSSAIGSYTLASATGAFASGKDTEATGEYSQALGYRAKAYGYIFFQENRFSHFEVRNREDLNLDELIKKNNKKRN